MHSSLQSRDFNFLLVHKGHSKSLFGSIKEDTLTIQIRRTSKWLPLTSRSRSMYCQLPLTNILQNTTSLCSFSIKFAKILRISRWIQLRQPADTFSHFERWNIRVYSVSDWELVTGHMLYISQSECQKVLAVKWTRCSFLWMFVCLLCLE